nr:substrate-binding domain-containing protein [uncultured Blautia sp.]
MKNSKRVFLFIEMILGSMVVVLASLMIREKNGEDLDRVAVIVQNSNDNQWTAFQYGLKVAAEDKKLELCMVSTGEKFTADELKTMIEQEMEKGTDGLIVQPAPGGESEKMLKKMEKKIPIMLVETAASDTRERSLFPVTEPKQYEMGAALGEELLKDYNGKIKDKTIGIFSENQETEAGKARKKGFMDVLEETGARVVWSVSENLQEQSKVDFVIALDDSSLVRVGAAATANNLHGALVYGIGKSTEAVYYLDTGIAVCLVVPDAFNMGYQSLTEMSEKLNSFFYTMQSQEISYTVLRRDTLFSKENQELLFTMSQ